jgi:hypothetical protein
MRASDERQRAATTTDERARQAHLELALFHEARMGPSEAANDTELDGGLEVSR